MEIVLLLVMLGLRGAAPAFCQTWNLKGSSLSMDPQGWAFQASIAAASDGTLYALWDQHRSPNVFECLSPRAAKWTGTSWQALGGRIAHSNGQDGVSGVNCGGEQGWTPSLATVGTVPYAAWYEGLGNFGWGWSLGASVFVAHWDAASSSWVYDYNAANPPNFALNTSSTVPARDPVIANINNAPYVAWIEDQHSTKYDYHDIVVKHLAAGSWTQDGTPLTLAAVDQEKIIGVALAAVSGNPVVAWSRARFKPGTPIIDSSSTVQAAELIGGSWTMMGGALNIAASDHVNYVAMTVMGTTPFVAWQEKTLTGPYQIYVSHWNGSNWVNDGGNLNANLATGDAGRPAIANDGSRVYLAWTEAAPNQVAQLYVRTLNGGVWSAPVGGLNAKVDGSANAPNLAMVGSSAQVIWSEFDTASNTKQVYVKGLDSSSGAPATVTPYGPNGPAVTIPNNTWVGLNPGGIASGLPTNNTVYTRPFVAIHYDPGLHKAISWGNYHDPYGGWDPSEQQNSMFTYDFQNNRWDMMEFTNCAWSEFLPGMGQEEGLAAVDPIHHLYITHGNLELIGTGGTYGSTFVYDLLSHRGQRMLPNTELNVGAPDSQASAFDTDHNVMMTVGVPLGGSWKYDEAANAWSRVSNTLPPNRFYPAMVYDNMNHKFIMYGGAASGATTANIVNSTDTWTYNTMTNGPWTKENPTIIPLVVGSTLPAVVNPFFAYDSKAGIALMTGGMFTSSPDVPNNQVWLYNAAANTWKQLPNLPAGAPDDKQGQFLTYDSDHDVFLLRDVSNLTNLWGFRYVPPSGLSSVPPARPQGLVLE